MTADSSAPATAVRASLIDVPHVHPPKVELFDVAGMTNTDPKGFVRHVDEYRLEPFGLYLARPTPGHPRMSYLESWLLPGFGLRVTRFQWHPGAFQDLDRYIDIVDVNTTFGTRLAAAAGPVWRVVDHYLDITVRAGRDLEVLDTDELLAATHAGLIGHETARGALERVYRTVDGISSHRYEVEGWLAGSGVTLTWRD